MTDTIIKGSGNSRLLKGPPNFLTMFPDYQSFGQAVAAGEVPFDLLGPNPAGCEVIGDSLNKETLLKDSTAALYGKGSNASPDDILAAIRPLIDAVNVKATGLVVSIGSYTGNGTNVNFAINCPGVIPKILLIITCQSSSKNGNLVIAINPANQIYTLTFGGNSYAAGSDVGFSWASGKITINQNSSSIMQKPYVPYYWAVIGTKV